MKNILLICLLSFSFVLQAQVYPYAFYPDQLSGQDRKMGLVDANNKKITEPIFDEIAFFQNQPRNHYSLYYTKKKFPEGSSSGYEIVSGIINSRGEVMPGISGKNIQYDGNGRIAFSNEKGLEVFNIKTGKSVFKDESNSDLRLEEIIAGDLYYFLLFDAKTKYYKIYDEHGKRKDATVPLGMRMEYYKTDKGKVLFVIKGGRKEYFMDVDGNRVVASLDYDDDMPAFLDMSGDYMQELKWEAGNAAEKYPGYTMGDIMKGYDGKARSRVITHNGKKGLININGDVILDCEYHHISPFYTDIAQEYKNDFRYLKVKKYASTGLTNLKGKVIVPVRFGLLTYNRSTRNFTAMSANRYWGYISANGKIHLPLECECLE